MYIERGFTREDLWDIREACDNLFLTEIEEIILLEYFFDYLSVKQIREKYNISQQKFTKNKDSLINKIREEMLGGNGDETT